MNKYQVNMVHPRQIVAKNLKGCNSSRTVTNFAQKNGVPWVWWKPTATQKVMLVDWTQFKTAWKQNCTETKQFGPKAGYKPATSKNYTSTQTTRYTTNKPRPRRTTQKATNNRTQYATTRFTRKRAA